MHGNNNTHYITICTAIWRSCLEVLSFAKRFSRDPYWHGVGAGNPEKRSSTNEISANTMPKPLLHTANSRPGEPPTRPWWTKWKKHNPVVFNRFVRKTLQAKINSRYLSRPGPAWKISRLIDGVPFIGDKSFLIYFLRCHPSVARNLQE